MYIMFERIENSPEPIIKIVGGFYYLFRCRPILEIFWLYTSISSFYDTQFCQESPMRLSKTGMVNIANSRGFYIGVSNY